MSNNDAIGMAWADRISFEEIKQKTGLSGKEVTKITRVNLKRTSYLSMEKTCKRKNYQT